MPMVKPCAREGCNVLTMGQLCLEHEREPRPAGDRSHAARVGAAFALFAVGVVGAALRARLGR